MQVKNFAGTTDSANVLFAIWSGNNDFGNHLDIGYNDDAWSTRIDSVVSSLSTASDLLYQKGARSIMLFNQIELPRVPYILNSDSATFRNYISSKIQIFNQRLSQAVPGLLNSHPGLQVFLIDIHTDVDYLLNTYSAYGFTQATLDALDDPNLTDKGFSGPGADYVFWDSEHPTTKTHELLAKWIGNALPAPVQPQPPPSITITTPQNGTQFTAPATISINVAIESNGWPISEVSFFQNDILLGNVDNPPYTFVLSSVVDGQSTLGVQAAYGSGQTIAATPIQVLIAPPVGQPPPLPWNHSDIGSVGRPGSSIYSVGTFTISGSGSDIWGTADAFQYNYQALRGDGAIIGRVANIQNTDGYAKGGLMFRESLNADSVNALVFVTPSVGPGFQNRTTIGGASNYMPGTSAAVPYWLKLERRGNTFNGYGSLDGSSWVLIGSVTIPMAQEVYVGLAVTAHNNTLLNATTFDHVQLPPQRPAPPPARGPRPVAARSVS